MGFEPRTFFQVIFTVVSSWSCICIFHHFMTKLLLLDIYYHANHILQPYIMSTEHKGLNPDTTALMWL